MSTQTAASGIKRLLCAMALLLTGTWASAATITILTSRLGSGYDELIDTLRDELVKTPGLKVKVFTLEEGDATAMARTSEDSAMTVTVGLQAAQQSLALPDLRGPVLSVLLPRASFEDLATTPRNGRKHTAVFIDQPPSRQLELVRSVLPSARTVGLIVGPATLQDEPIYRNLARNRGLSVLVERANRETELYPVLQSVLRSSDVLLALPDSAIVNVSTAQNLLLTSFRFRVPVIGYSASYVRAGALAAVYSTPRQIGLEAGQIARQFLRNGTLPQAKYPRYFSVTVNRQMAASLNLTVPEEGAIVQRLQQLEGLE